MTNKFEMYQALKDLADDIEDLSRDDYIFTPDSRTKKHVTIARNLCRQYEEERQKAEELQAQANVLNGFPPE